MEPLEAMREMRATLVRRATRAAVRAGDRRVCGRSSTWWSSPPQSRGDWAKELKIKDLAQETGGVCFPSGMPLLLRRRSGHVARTCVEILKQAGIDFGIFGKNEKCCGGRAYDMGYRDDYHAKAIAI